MPDDRPLTEIVAEGREDILPSVPPATTEADALIRLAYDARFGGHDWQRRAYSYLWRDRAAAPHDGAAVREAAEELQRIDNLLARRITLDGLTRVQKIALALRVCEETDPKGEVAARYVCRCGAKGGA